MKITLNLQMITMPNYLHYEIAPVQKQDGFKPDKNIIPVGNLDEDSANTYAEEMKQKFLEHWRKQRVDK